MKIQPTFAIGDIHGSFEKLIAVLAGCRKVGGSDSRFILLGDYIDRGPDSMKVVELLMKEQQSEPDNFICLLGNHESMLLAASSANRLDGDLISWWQNGGEQTLASYGVRDPREIPQAHIDWIETCRLSFEDSQRLYVHAGVRPGIPLNKQTSEDRLWIREPFLSSREEFDKLVVHGHTPTASGFPDLQPNRLNLDTGACFGGALTAAAFVSGGTLPDYFISSDGPKKGVARPQMQAQP